MSRGPVFLWNGATPAYAYANPGTPSASIPPYSIVGTPPGKAVGQFGATPAFVGAGGYKWAYSLPSSPAEATLIAWAAANTSAAEYSLIGCCNSGDWTPLLRLEFGGSGVGPRFQVRGDGGTVINLGSSDISAWSDYLIVGVFRSGSGTKELWVNGVRVNTSTTDIGAITFNTTDVAVLSRSSPVQYLNGRLYGGAIFDRALTAREIQERSYNLWLDFEPEPIQIYWSSIGGSTLIDLTASSFRFTGQSIQPKTTVNLSTNSNFLFSGKTIKTSLVSQLSAATFRFTANSIAVGGQIIIDLSRATFNFVGKAINTIQNTAIQLGAASFRFIGNSITVTGAIAAVKRGGGMMMMLARKLTRRYRDKIGKHE